MASILDFTINYRSDDETINTRNVFFAPPPPQKKIELFRAKNKLKVFNLHFDSRFVSCSYKGEFRRHFGFFHLNLLVSNFYFWSAMLTEINHTIVKIFSDILIVTVNI